QPGLASVALQGLTPSSLPPLGSRTLRSSTLIRLSIATQARNASHLGDLQAQTRRSSDLSAEPVVRSGVALAQRCRGNVRWSWAINRTAVWFQYRPVLPISK